MAPTLSVEGVGIKSFFERGKQKVNLVLETLVVANANDSEPFLLSHPISETIRVSFILNAPMCSHESWPQKGTLVNISLSSSPETVQNLPTRFPLTLICLIPLTTGAMSVHSVRLYVMCEKSFGGTSPIDLHM